MKESNASATRNFHLGEANIFSRKVIKRRIEPVLSVVKCLKVMKSFKFHFCKIRIKSVSKRVIFDTIYNN